MKPENKLCAFGECFGLRLGIFVVFPQSDNVLCYQDLE